MSPTQLLDQLIGILPAFRDYWGQSDNLSIEDDGSFTLCGVFMQCGWFVKDNYERLTQDQLSRLGAFLSQCVGTSDDELDTAAATCMVENLTHEIFSTDFRTYLAEEALAYFDRWHDG